MKLINNQINKKKTPKKTKIRITQGKRNVNLFQKTIKCKLKLKT